MYTFNVEQQGDKLIVTSNTFWNCNVYGNFMLSKYSSTGINTSRACNEEIDIIVPKELPGAQGEVIFSYGDDRCRYPSISVFLVNECYIRTEPMFTEVNGQRILRIKYKEENDAITVKVYSNGIWSASGSGLFTNGDELLIAASDCKEVVITPNIGCADDKKVTIILEKE